jgi:trehalose 6-phosphate phosphatase
MRGTSPLIEPATQNDAGAFLKTVARAPQSALLLDYDGTLAPFRAERDQALPYPGVAPALQAIVSSGRTRVFIVTGRQTDDIVSLLGIYPCPEIWGLHGIQRRKPHGKVEMACVDESLVQALMEADRWLKAQDLRQMAEFKPGSIAVHWRGLSESKAADIRRRLLLGWSPIAQRAGAELLEFDGGIELRAPEPDKGDAVLAILEQFDADAPVAYLGDDTTDERAFLALEGRGLRVLVRPEQRATAADLWLKPPGELLEFLASWLSACQSTEGGK